jgi:beta-N-acetylhexosaminidase
MTYDRDGRLAAACVMGSYDGADVPAWLLERITAGLGGVCLFAQNVVDDAQLTAATAELHAARPGVVLAIDEEGGDVTRLDAANGSATPAPAAFGAVDDVQLTRLAYRSLGSRVTALGIDLVLAPCADINSDERNPIIGVRSFGGTPDVVARHVVASITGFHDGGAGTCAKHFPGHGDTVADTHHGTATVEASLKAMHERELVPFRAAIDAGIDAMLTAHIIAGCVDDEPASVSRRWTELLRDHLEYDGVIITDALDMRAVAGDRGDRGVADTAVRALAAGADLLCLGSNFDAERTDLVVTTIAAAIADGRLDRDALERSATRIAKLRRAHDAHLPRPAVELTVAADVARRAVDVTGVVPVGMCTVVECRPRPTMAAFNVTWGLARHLAELGWQSQAVGEHAEVDVTSTTGRDVVVVVRDLDVHPWQRLVVDAVASSASSVVVVELGWPSTTPPPAAAYIVSHGAALASTRAVARLLDAREA